MKKTFYDMLGVPPDARQDLLQLAYEQQQEELNATTNVRGRTEVVRETKLLREGYQILSDPTRRAQYDAKIAAHKSGVKLVFFPHGADRKGVVESVVLVALLTFLGGEMYYQVSRKMDEVRIEHTQAVIREREEKSRVRVIDATQLMEAATAVAQKSGTAAQR